MSAEESNMFFIESIPQPADRIKLVGDKLISYWSANGFVASTTEHTTIIPVESSNDAHYAALLKEAGPDGTMHHPV